MTLQELKAQVKSGAVDTVLVAKEKEIMQI